MKSISKMTRIFAIGMLVGACFVGRVDATPLISIVPASQTKNVGDTVTADIDVSNLGLEQVGGVSLLLSFNTAVLSGLSFVNDPDAKMGFAACGAPCDFGSSFNGGTGSPLELFFLASGSLTSAQLSALQGGGFRLATVSFKAIANGFSQLALSADPANGGVFLSDGDGAVLDATSANGGVCVGGNCGTAAAVPEPGTIALLASGLAGLAARRRRSAATRA